MKKYKMIYADPAWSYDNQNTGGSMISGANAKYSTMSLEEIKELPVKDISSKDSVLFLWATVPLLPEALEVMKEWGYQYKTTIFWRKIMSLGMGFWFRGQVEMLLFGVKGKVKAFRCQKCNFIQSKVRKHSQKPTQIYGLLEEISKKHNLDPKVELFARERRQGWDVWGNQVPNHTQALLSAESFNKDLTEDCKQSSQIISFGNDFVKS